MALFLSWLCLAAAEVGDQVLPGGDSLIGPATVTFRPPSSILVAVSASHCEAQPNDGVTVLVNARVIASCADPCALCRVTLPPGVAGNVQSLSVALYAAPLSSGSRNHSRAHLPDTALPTPPIERYQLLGFVEGTQIHVGPPESKESVELFKKSGALVQTVAATAIKGRPRILLYNTVETAPQAQAAQQRVAQRQAVPTVEEVVRSDGNLTCSELGGFCGVYHATPTLNGRPSYYCWWRARPGSNRSECTPLTHPCTDCPNITSNAATLAALWHSTGIDAVVPDTTNLARWDQPNADVINIRPVEVLAEELAALRGQGIATPDMAVWTSAAPDTTMYRGMLRVINQPSFGKVQLREPSSGKAVYFVHNGGQAPDPKVVAAIEANGGGSNVSTITMWANVSPEQAANGTWTFFQPCQRTSEPLDFTLTVLNDGEYRCNHLKSAATAGGLGSQMSAAMSWQNSQTSFAWASPSKMMGLTFQAMIDDALRERPENIMLPSFDEWGAGPIPTAPSTWVAQGAVGFTPPEQHVQFCDTFGAERSRTWAPTEEAGDFYLRLTQSCLRVVALAAASGATTCDVADELCCDRKVPQFTRVFSLQSFNTSKPDYFVTNNAEEAKRVQQLGEYTEICASSPGPYSTDYFCYTPGLRTFAARMGPFILYSLPEPPAKGRASLLHMGSRSPVHRCAGGDGHFMSADPNCEARGKSEGILGYASVKRHTGMPRKLRRCRRPDGVCYHTLDAYCLNGDAVTTLGHVL